MTPPDNEGRYGDGSGTASHTPPWQRVSKGTVDTDETAYLGRPDAEFRGGDSGGHTGDLPLVTGSAAGPYNDTGMGTNEGQSGGGARQERAKVTAEAPAKGRSTPSALRRPGRGPRRASLQVKRVDPWSVLKLSLVLGVALFLVWMVAVGLLYIVLDGMGVWNRLNGTYTSLVSGEGADAPAEPLISAGRVFGVAGIVGAINIVLLSALATVSAFIYNVSADLAGGLEVTLSERE